MGQKRSFGEDDVQELSLKHPKNHPAEQLTSVADFYPSYGALQKADIPGGSVGNFCDAQSKDDSHDIISDKKEFETSAPISVGTSSTSEEDAESGAVLYSSLFPEFFEFGFPRRSLIQIEDPYSYLLNAPPVKEVPIGEDHQADIPVWVPEVIKKHSISYPTGNSDDNGEVRQGACVLPVSDLDLSADVGKTKDGRLGCSCLDGGSVRCVQQHVKEAREELKETIGLEKFVNLGFLDMGEEVAHRWTEEEERLFHEVVYSNSLLHGKKFWLHLSVMFPFRTNKELVSYYFNVFVLRRRAAQNRSRCLDIDSDDDEWQGNDGGHFGVVQDVNLATVSFINQDVHVDQGDDSPNKYVGADDDDSTSNDGNTRDSDDCSNNDDGDDAFQYSEANATENVERTHHAAMGKNENSFDDTRFGLVSFDLARSLLSLNESLGVQDDDTCTLEVQPCMTSPCYPTTGRASLQENKINSPCGKFSQGDCTDGSSHRFSPEYALEPYYNSSMGVMKSVDLLPTCNMMEEIFGPCTQGPTCT